MQQQALASMRDGQRHGPVGTIELQFEGTLTRFSDLIRDENLPDHH